MHILYKKDENCALVEVNISSEMFQHQTDAAVHIRLLFSETFPYRRDRN